LRAVSARRTADVQTYTREAQPSARRCCGGAYPDFILANFTVAMYDTIIKVGGEKVSETVNQIKKILLEKCEQHKKNPRFGYYDYWNDHIKLVVKYAVELAEQYGADVEIAELGALLHDISMPSEYGDRSEHHIYSAEMAETLLTELKYPPDKISVVRKCVFNHPGRNARLRNTLEENCVSDADALAHFDRIPSLFSLAYNIHHMTLDEGREYVKKRLQGDFDGLTERTKQLYKNKFETILNYLFVD
jgi:uncharacterized protein